MGGSSFGHIDAYNTVIYNSTAGSQITAPVNVLSHCILHDLEISPVVNQVNNVYGDPIFNNNNGDFRLQDESPGINSGLNDVVSSNTILDLAGELRIKGGTIDIGAYESDVIPPVEPEIIYIDADATGSNDGSSWNNAYSNLRDALVSSNDNEEYWIAEGTYFITNTDDINSYLAVTSSIEVYGGFSGNETERSQRDWATNPVVWSGNIGDPDLNTDNSRSLIRFFSGNSLIDGIIIEEVVHTDSGDSGSRTLTVLADAEFTMRNSIFRSNVGWNNSAILSSGTTTIENCLFHDNHQLSGGSMVSVGGGGAITATNCTFANNTWDTSFGSAIGGNNLGDITVINTIISNSQASSSFPSAISSFSHCLLPDNNFSTATDTVNIITDEAVFVDSANGDFRLASSSPGINAGLNGALSDGLDLDLSGESRVYGDTIDIGAYETQTAPTSGCPADLDNNGVVEVSDLLLLLSNFGCTSDCSIDITGSGTVDAGDLLMFLSGFGSNC